MAAGALGFAFSEISDKDAAWSDLHRLTQDVDSEVREMAAGALGSAFSDISDKDTAWSDLHRLTQDGYSEVRQIAAGALGTAFSEIPDKDAAWSNLYRLTQDENSDVQMHAYHSLGSASVYKATETDDEAKFRDELKKAIDYFESSSRESVDGFYNPARFCLPFYRSYYAIISEKKEAEATKYFEEAKEATGRSESRETLLKAVENLANALKEAQKPLDFGETQEHLRACRQYCDHTAELADSTRGKSPVAAAAIMRGIPIVGAKVKEIIAEIQEKAEALYKKTKGTSLEEIGFETVKSAKKLTTDDTIKFYRILENIGNKLNKFCEYLPDDAKKSICGKIRDSRNLDVIEQAETIDQGFDYMLLHFPIPPIITISANKENKQKQDIVRIAAIQLAFKLTNSFPPTLEKKDECKPKIISALDTAKSSGAHIACLPELCMCEEWVQEFKDRYPDMIIIGGSYYKNGFNECPIIMNMEVPL
jgi:HEAT repeat protein